MRQGDTDPIEYLDRHDWAGCQEWAFHENHRMAWQFHTSNVSGSHPAPHVAWRSESVDTGQSPRVCRHGNW